MRLAQFPGRGRPKPGGVNVEDWPLLNEATIVCVVPARFAAPVLVPGSLVRCQLTPTATPGVPLHEVVGRQAAVQGILATAGADPTFDLHPELPTVVVPIAGPTNAVLAFDPISLVSLEGFRSKTLLYYLDAGVLKRETVLMQVRAAISYAIDVLGPALQAVK